MANFFEVAIPVQKDKRTAEKAFRYAALAILILSCVAVSLLWSVLHIYLQRFQLLKLQVVMQAAWTK
jgi:uncharacterized integral membrane protein